ncbi:odorant receptor 131-2-like [Pholidichthys leucotaenia]
MVSGLRSQSNHTSGLQYRTFLELFLISAPTTTVCCVFLIINSIMIVTLMSKPVFREHSCYILLFNLLVSDTMFIPVSQLFIFLSIFRVRLTYPACGFLISMLDFIARIAPFTVVLMAVERYVAVCHPLRHATIATIRNTRMGIVMVWAFVSVTILIKVLLLLDFPFSDLKTLLMKDFCNSLSMTLTQISDLYNKVYSGVLFVSAAMVITSSYVRVAVVARSASVDKASAWKARNTLLLHLIQLSLCLCETLHDPLIIGISKVLGRAAIMRIWNIFYIFMVLIPRFLSSLIYGLRDKTIRTMLMHHICCRLTLKVNVNVEH